jgi:hypothetical protein
MKSTQLMHSKQIETLKVRFATKHLFTFRLESALFHCMIEIQSLACYNAQRSLLCPFVDTKIPREREREGERVSGREKELGGKKGVRSKI